MAEAMARLEAWRESGGFLTVPCSTGGTGPHRVWVRVAGDGPALTLIHGFPTSSFDMAAVATAMEPSRRVLALDMVGFGESDRPADHAYAVTEQADAVCAMWSHHGVSDTEVFAHDLGATVAQELLHRRAQDRLPVRLRSVVFANGGIYPDLHRPLPFQTALADPAQGPAVSAALTEDLLAPSVQATFGPNHQPSADEVQAMWSTISRHDGQRNLHLLIRYMDERREHAAEWVGALESTDVPLGFVWGMLDPISGAHIAERIVERFPAAPRMLLDDVGHWPPLEAPHAVVAVLREVAALAR